MHSRLLAGAGLALVLAAPLAAQVQYDIPVNKALSPGTWDGNTSVGPVNGNKNFNLDGMLSAGLGAASAPFGTIELNGGDLFTDPSTIVGTVPNPIPFLPPLARAEVKDLHIELSSPEAAIAANGDFATDIVVTVTQGSAEVSILGGAPLPFPLAGLVSDPYPITGSVTESGGDVVVQSAVFLRIDLALSGITGYFEFDGDAYANGPIQTANLNLAVNNLVAGQTASFDVSGGFSNSLTFVVYSLSGPGSVYVPQFDVTLGVGNPTLLAGPTAADGNGAISWPASVPAGTSGRNVWFQAAQQTAASNVVATTIG